MLQISASGSYDDKSAPPAMATPPANNNELNPWDFFWPHQDQSYMAPQQQQQQQHNPNVSTTAPWSTAQPALAAASSYLPSPPPQPYLPSPTVPTFLSSPIASAPYPRHSAPPPSPSSSRGQRNHLPCPFYVQNPSSHPKCAQKTFSYMCRVREHISTHTLPFSCDICERRFSSRFGLTRHTDTCRAGGGGRRRLGGGGGGGGGGHGRRDENLALHQALTQAGSVEAMVGILARPF